MVPEKSSLCITTTRCLGDLLFGNSGHPGIGENVPVSSPSELGIIHGTTTAHL